MLAKALMGASGFVPIATYEFGQATGSGSNLSTYTFSDVDIGTASSSRYVVVLISFASLSGTLTSSTIAGQSATELVNAFGGTSGRLSIVGATISSGTTATIVVNFSAAPLRCTIATYAVYDLQSTTPVNTLSVGSATSGNSLSGSINVEKGGVVIGGSYINSASVTTTFTNLTEDFERVEESARTTAGGADLCVATTNLTITATFSATLPDNKALIAASFR